jgi:hypothetical protein
MLPAGRGEGGASNRDRLNSASGSPAAPAGPLRVSGGKLSRCRQLRVSNELNRLIMTRMPKPMPRTRDRRPRLRLRARPQAASGSVAPGSSAVSLVELRACSMPDSESSFSAEHWTTPGSKLECPPRLTESRLAAGSPSHDIMRVVKHSWFRYMSLV